MGLAGLPINAVATTGEAYVQGLIIQANNQREAAATDILQRANDTMQALADGTNAQRVSMKQKVDNAGKYTGQTPGPSSGSVRHDIERGYLNTSAHEAGVYPGNRDTDYGRSDLRGSGSGLYPAGYDEGGPVSDRVMSSPRIPNRFVTEGEVGSRLNPISDPQDLMGVDLLHTRVNGDWHRNGVVGGWCGPHGWRPRFVGECSRPRCCRCPRARRNGRERERHVRIACGIVLRSGLRDLQGTLWYRRPIWYRRS